MKSKLGHVSKFIGNTRLRPLELDGVDLFAKLEYENFSGSVKDRAAINILTEAVHRGEVNEDTTVVESSSGNFAIALATICNVLGIRFIPVLDPNVNAIYEEQLKLMCKDVVTVEERDPTGGFLLTRIATVKEICNSLDNTFWTNQYENIDNYMGYYDTLAVELLAEVPKLDYLFVAVSSGGTVTGISRRLKEENPNIKIIAVDLEGSVVFQNEPKRRYVSGLGSSKVPIHLKAEYLDDVIIVSHEELISGCFDLIKEQQLFVGGSSGAVYHAIKQYFETHSYQGKPSVAFLCCDRGMPYMDTVYNTKWCENTFGFNPRKAVKKELDLVL